jgi:hypothetical protein
MCELMDPARPDHDPRYGPVLVEMAAKPPAYPPLAAQAAGLAGSLWEWAVSGFAVAGDEEQGRRLSICAACPHWDAAARRCRLCGCATDYKVRMRTEHCPVGKW